MLSFLIPIYNFEIKQLITQISNQAIKLKIKHEIVLIDDCSNKYFQFKNQSISNLPFTSLIALSENIGRTKIRNLLVEKSKFDFLVFIDCDSLLSNNLFVENYAQNINKKIVCGGTKYANNPTKDNKTLRWKYGYFREQTTLKKRKQYPYNYLFSNNFGVQKSVIKQFPFYADTEGYGYEDNIFAKQLKNNNISICHIDNSVLHMGIDTNDEFIQKTKTAIKNLKKYYNQDILTISDVKLLKVMFFFEKYKLKNIFISIVKLMLPFLKKNLLSKNPNLRLFDIYRVYLLCSDDSILS